MPEPRTPHETPICDTALRSIRAAMNDAARAIFRDTTRRPIRFTVRVDRLTYEWVQIDPSLVVGTIDPIAKTITTHCGNAELVIELDPNRP